jgi:hypothetical protein
MKPAEPYGAKIYVLDTHTFVWWPAAARVTRRPLLTADERIANSGLVDVIWE